ncbi:MAG: hypothetical protein V3V78_01510 [Candidatus Woesearchaeota archaeon]
MVTKEEFGQFIAEVESFRDLMIEELGKLKTEIEYLKDSVEEIARQTKINVNKKIG